MKISLKYFLPLLTLISITLFGFAQEFPANPQKLVSDFTNTLSPEQIAILERKLVAFDDSTSNQVAVVLVKSVGDYDINEYALELGRKWGVGSQGKNNGVILLVAVGDRKLSIQTGYGLEGALPDIYTKRIIENDIKPYFKEGDYFQGINAGTNSIISLIKGEYKNDKKKAANPINKGGSGLIVIIIIIIIFIIGKRGGGNGGGGKEVFSGRGVAEGLLWGMLLGGGRNHGGGFGGGGFGGSGGGFGGGGFGGFGGGSFGGGGSSGSW
ncbi:MAG: TPM domain-containing protein [Pedobacter sp.]|nr:MAG: TPM domain-containing protein [Pedobacter sp.]